MTKIVNVHYVDKTSFMNAEIVDNEEEVLTFGASLVMRRLLKKLG